MALREAERGYLEAHPERYARRRSRPKLIGYGIGAAVLLIPAIAGTVAIPTLWEHFSALTQSGYESVRPNRGPGMAFVGVIIALALLWLFGLLLAHAALFRAKDWIDTATGHRVRIGRTARFGDLGAYDRWLVELQSGRFTIFPEAPDRAGTGRVVLQTIEDRDAGTVVVWLEASDGRSVAVPLEAAAARPLLTA